MEYTITTIAPNVTAASAAIRARKDASLSNELIKSALVAGGFAKISMQFLPKNVVEAWSVLPCRCKVIVNLAADTATFVKAQRCGGHSDEAVGEIAQTAVEIARLEVSEWQSTRATIRGIR